MRWRWSEPDRGGRPGSQPGGRVARWAVVAVCALVWSSAGATPLLDLDPPRAPELRGGWADRLAERLDPEADGGEPVSGGEGSEGAGRGSAGERAAQAVRTIAGAWLRHANEAGPEASVHALAGAHMAGLLDRLSAESALDEWGGRPRRLRELVQSAEALARTPPPASQVHGHTAEIALTLTLMAGRDAEPIAWPIASGAGWAGVPAQQHARLRRWRDHESTPDDVAGVIRGVDLHRVADAAQQQPSSSAGQALALATSLAELLIERGRWVEPDARARLVEELEALLSIPAVDAIGGADGLDHRLAASADLLTVLLFLDAARPEQHIREARHAMHRLLEDAWHRHALRLRGATLLIELVLDARALSDERVIVRSLRPVHRATRIRVEQAGADTTGQLSRVLAHDGWQTDLGVLGTISNHRTSMEDLRRVHAINRVLTDGREDDREPRVARDRRALERQVVRLARDAVQRDDHEAQRALRSLGDDARCILDLDSWVAFPARDTEAWDSLTGGRGGQVAGMIERMTRQWLDDEEQREQHSDRLAQLRRLTALLRDGAAAARIARGERAATMDDWPGWRLSPEAWGALLEMPADEVQAATRLLLRNDQQRIDAALDRAEQAAGPLRLAARLEREAEAHGLGGAQRGDAAGVLVWPSSAPDAQVHWMGWAWRDLASFCRYAEELAEARRMSRQDRSGALEALLRQIADGVLRAYPSRSSRRPNPSFIASLAS